MKLLINTISMKCIETSFITLLLCLTFTEFLNAETEGKPRFNRDIRPILSENCFQCHGPDKNARQSDFRLDVAKEVFEKKAIIPGDSTNSPVYLRIISKDSDERMPPAESPHQLSSSNINLIKKWIDSGAEYENHWSFIPLRNVPVPEMHENSWVKNEIDAFILERLQKENLEPSPEAEKTELIRRVTFDLTGLPPTIKEIDEFLNDTSSNAYEKLVDRLLSSPHYGERMAAVWMDAARYADSGGYQGDLLRSMWRWRDWVINAYNENMPFDQFTIEQLAGDLLPKPSLDQKIATGFNRNHRINDEDGIILEEYRVEYVADRIETTGSVWLGLTIGCARCHDHKYDPITQKNYYQLFSFFNNINEKGRGARDAPPFIRFFSGDQETRFNDLTQKILKTAEINDSEEQKKKREKLNKEKEALDRNISKAMVMEELPEPRETHILIRGTYNKHGEKVSYGVPESISPPFQGFSNNRLGLANWILSEENPLTARVAVNRYWQMYFGRGIVNTTEDFGSQGEWPDHPELLDWLGYQFIHSGWNIKEMQKLIVTSATYRQSSRGSQMLYSKDPENRLLARGPRFRMDFEMIRDMALASSGLLVRKIGGPSVRPYQPEGLWKELASNNLDYNQEEGENLYRRSLYTFFRRTIPPPSMKTFDSPGREVCSLRRQRTNTPLQALVMMNDPTFIESARVLAERLMQDQDLSNTEIIQTAFRSITSRFPDEAELEVLEKQLAYSLKRYEGDEASAIQMIETGESKPNQYLNPGKLAAYTTLCSLIMNLDEAITRE